MIQRIIFLLTTLLFSCAAFGDVYVRGHYRSNGTYVAPHYRSSPDGVFSNNWSTVGNINPYTGKLGTRKAPDTDYKEWRKPSPSKAITQKRSPSTRSSNATISLPTPQEGIQATLPSIQRPTLTGIADRAKDSSQVMSGIDSSNQVVQPPSLIRESQEYLNYLGFNVGTVDGILGGRTRAAIYAYQRTRSLTVNGKVDEPLLEAMSLEISENSKQIASRVRPSASENPSEENNGELIERTQFYLKVIGHYDGPNNGVKDTELEHAIMRFQNSNRISVDGQPSPQLLSSIKSKLYKGFEVQSTETYAKP